MVPSTVLALLAVLQIQPVELPRQPTAARATARGYASVGVRSAKPDPMASRIMRSDARLADVCFVDPTHGWAVGDRGTIWHTGDGGAHWQLQPSGVSCRLESVSFIDRQTGWAAGGFSHPYTHTSTAVLLTTRDGGRTWKPIPTPLLPALKRVRFVDPRHGFAIGGASAMYPAGIFVTDTGGREWTSLSGTRRSAWLAGDLINPHTGAVVGRQGSVATVRRGTIEPARSAIFGLRNVTQVRLLAPMEGWLVGDAGLVMRTSDLGANWQVPPGALPEGTAEQFDFKALAVRGPKCWIAGSPGTRVFHSPDAGRTWTAVATESQVPIHAITFIDDRQGWAVGSLGTILVSRDGGQSWHRQRSGGQRAAMLAIFGDAKDVPLELFARLSGNEGYLATVEVLGRRGIETVPRGDAHLDDRLHEALLGVGASEASSTWRFPLRQEGLRLKTEQIVAAWDRANDGQAINQLHRHIVRKIRLWRPEIIVTHDADVLGKDPLGHLINQAVLQAVDQAADPTRFPRQITDAGLEPWQVKKVYASLGPGQHGSADLTTGRFATRLGCSLADVAAVPRGLIHEKFEAAQPTLGFRLLLRRTPESMARSDFFTGIQLSPGSDARRELLDPPAGSLAQLQRAAALQRNVRAILKQSAQKSRGGSQLMAQTSDLLRGVGRDGAGRILFHLADNYRKSGRWSMAADTFELLRTRYPDHPMTRPAMVWLVQYYASAEAAWRVEGGQREDHGIIGKPSVQRNRPSYAVSQASALTLDPELKVDRPSQAAELGKHIERTDPALYADPALRFPLAAAHSRQGYSVQARRYFLNLARSTTADAWRDCAAGEQWLAGPKGSPPKTKPILYCLAAASKPRLDGKLDDPVWEQAKQATLTSAVGDDEQWPATVMMAYDKEFLYLAIRCRRAPGTHYDTTKTIRDRDGDLSAQDRVDLLLDLDHDFTTYYRLTIDHRGHPGEGCWGDATWNPTWYMTAKTADGQWTAEAAIPLDQLTGQFPTPQTVWAIGLQRTVPGTGFQSWTTPAATTVRPEGFGYLIFR